MTKGTQSKTQKNLPTKPSVGASAPSPSAGALRAARHFIALGLLTTPIHAAEIIDRETGVAELLEAAKFALTTLDYYDQQAEFGFHGPLRKKLKQAIAKCESGTGSE